MTGDVEIAEPGPGQVRVRHCGVCHSDLPAHRAHGEVPRLLALWRAGRLDLEGMITRRGPLDEIEAAFDDLRAARGLRTVLAC